MDVSALEGEERIVWLVDVAALDYVRQALFLTHRRRGRPLGWRIGRLVGYAELRRDAPNDGACYVFARRVFYLMGGDRDAEPGGVYSRHNAPMEAVDPRTVLAGEPGKLTERAWGGALPDPAPLIEHEPSVVPAPHPGPLPVPWWFERRLRLQAQRRDQVEDAAGRPNIEEQRET
jgi:hypothetical protein